MPDLGSRLRALGDRLVEREASHEAGLETAWQHAREIHTLLAEGVEHYHDAVLTRAPHLRVELGEPRVDDKHLHSVEVDLQRGRHRAIITFKSKGEVTLVGPFHAGKTEGPCKSHPLSESEKVRAAASDFLLQFVEEATAP